VKVDSIGARFHTSSRQFVKEGEDGGRVQQSALPRVAARYQSYSAACMHDAVNAPSTVYRQETSTDEGWPACTASSDNSRSVNL